MRLVLMVKWLMPWTACFLKRREGFGMYEVLGIAAVLIVAAFVIIPGFVGFAEGIIAGMTGWWDDISEMIFADQLTDVSGR